MSAVCKSTTRIDKYTILLQDYYMNSAVGTTYFVVKKIKVFL